MSFWKKLWRKAAGSQEKGQSKNTMIMMESDTLGMTVVEDVDESGDQVTHELTPEEWVEIISNHGFDGVPYNRLYFSFLKGIPDFLRFKIWLVLCTDTGSKNYKFMGTVSERYSTQIKKHKSSKQQEQQGDSKEKEKQKEKEKEKQEQKQSSQLFSVFSLPVFRKLCESKAPEKQIQQIKKDVHRTYANKQDYLYTSPMLEKILLALSNSGVEYTQGMNYILLYLIIFCLESIGIGKEEIESLPLELERDIFIILREIVLRLDEVFGNNNVFKVMKELEEKISESVPDVLYNIYKMGMDSYSLFSQHYFSLLTYSDPPIPMAKQMMDLFFLEGEKAITAVIVRMLEISQDQILKLEQPEDLQKFIKTDIFHFCYKTYAEERDMAKCISDFGLSFYQNVTKC